MGVDPDLYLAAVGCDGPDLVEAAGEDRLRNVAEVVPLQDADDPARRQDAVRVAAVAPAVPVVAVAPAVIALTRSLPDNPRRSVDKKVSRSFSQTEYMD